MKLRILFLTIALMFVLSACGEDSNVVFPDGDDSPDGDGEITDGDTPDDGDEPEDGDIENGDGESEEDQEPVGPGDTKCDIDRHNPDRDIEAKTGGTVQLCDAGHTLDGTKAVIPPNTLIFDIHAAISTVDDLAVEGFVPVGPAVQFKASALNAGERVELGDDIDFSIPYVIDELPELARDFHVNIAFLLDPEHGMTNGPDNAPYLIAKTPASIDIDEARELLHFRNKEFGIFQAMVPTEILPPTSRRFTYRAFAGISMGCFGAAMTGMGKHEMFDILGPMGGVMDLGYLMDNLYRHQTAGFCTHEEIINAPEGIDAFVTDETKECGYCGLQRNPDHWSEPDEKCYMVPPKKIYERDEHTQGFNHWYYDDNGGNFDRDEYTQLFRDLVYAYGNFTSYNPESPYLAAGITGERLDHYVNNVYRPDGRQGCDQLAEYMGTDPIMGLYDWEHNPDGSRPVIAFCDGTQDRAGDWKPSTDPQARSHRLDLALAVDYNENGVRDFGEPVVRQFWERFEDCGTDGICDVDEEGYDAVSNPDPAKDNYNPYINNADFNPFGSEQNGHYDEGEPYLDYGLDGVQCPEGEDCMYDYGEGNGSFDYNPNVVHIMGLDPVQKINEMPIEDLKRLNIWMDGGIRDIFNFAIHGDNMAGALHGRLSPEGLDTGVFQQFTSLMIPKPDELNKFRFLKVNYGQLGHNVMMRFGNYDATDDHIRAGDGRHVGFASQVVFRVQTFYSFCNYHFPNGNFEPVDSYDINALMLKRRYHSDSLRRMQKYSVALPPGYFKHNSESSDGEPHQCSERFPVIYLMHGYGMEPEGLAAAIPILFGYMSQGIFQKFITVLPDGKCDGPDACRDDCKTDCVSAPDREVCRAECEAEKDCENVLTECEQGTFYANLRSLGDDPVSNTDDSGFVRGQIEDSLMDLVNYMDTTYCTKPEEVVEVDGATLDGLY